MTTKKKLTAEEARKISMEHDPTIAMNAILSGIEETARTGSTVYVTREYGFGDGSCYTTEERYPTLCKAILKELRDLGYVATVKSKTSQFVDIYLEVKW